MKNNITSIIQLPNTRDTAMKSLRLTGLLATGLFTVSTQAALYDRGNGMIYDDVMDITWLQDANYAQTSGHDADGLMSWTDANTWVNGLSYGGYDDWRLPSANLINSADPCYAKDGSCDRGFNNSTGELGHMFYTDLDNLGKFATNSFFQSGYGVTNSDFIDGISGNSVSILNLQNSTYWLDEEYAPNTSLAWTFITSSGSQFRSDKTTTYYSWAIRDGDVSEVPIPAAAWLFGTALLGLAGASRRNRQ